MANTQKGNSAEFGNLGDSIDSGNLCDSVKLFFGKLVVFGHIVN